MKKIWFFVEGDSEENLVINLIEKHNELTLEKDESKFINGNFNKNVCYCVNTCGVDKIPHQINDYFEKEKIVKSQSNIIFVICDVETKLICNINRKNNIENILKESCKKLDIKYIFFNPMIESLYWDCPKILTYVLNKFYKDSNGDNDIKSKIILPSITKSYCYEIKELFRKYYLKYRESQFSKEFFPRMDFYQCNNPVIIRLMEKINITLS